MKAERARRCRCWLLPSHQFSGLSLAGSPSLAALSLVGDHEPGCPHLAVTQQSRKCHDAVACYRQTDRDKADAIAPMKPGDLHRLSIEAAVLERAFDASPASLMMRRMEPNWFRQLPTHDMPVLPRSLDRSLGRRDAQPV